MKKMRKIIAVMLAVCMVCMGSTVATAEDVWTAFFSPSSQQIEQSPDHFSTENQQLIHLNVKNSNEYVLNKSHSRSGAQKYLSVANKIQTREDYCGPAVAQMILAYKGKSYTQTTLASANYCDVDNMGSTYVYKLRDTLNVILNPNVDTYVDIGTWEQNFSAGLIYSIDKGYPVACHVDTSYLPIYNGASFGHHVLATGYSYGFTGTTSENKVRYNDPHYDSRYSGTFTIDWMRMTEAIDGNAGYFIRKA